MTDTSVATKQQAPSSSTSGMQSTGHGELFSDHGTTSISDAVVAKIAGVATKEMSGVHAMGSGAGRAMGALRGKVGRPNIAQGVAVEVGQRQTAIDLDVIVDYGVPIVDLSQAIRDNVVAQVEQMTGLEVTEVNISVNDVYLGDTEPEEPRVQ